jgi:hypothetical protein
MRLKTGMKRDEIQTSLGKRLKFVRNTFSVLFMKGGKEISQASVISYFSAVSLELLLKRVRKGMGEEWGKGRCECKV